MSLSKCHAGKARTRDLFRPRGCIPDLPGGIKRSFPQRRAVHFERGFGAGGRARRYAAVRSAVAPFSTGRDVSRFYCLEVVKPNGMWTRLAIPPYRCRRLNTRVAKGSFRLRENNAASSRKPSGNRCFARTRRLAARVLQPNYKNKSIHLYLLEIQITRGMHICTLWDIW